jgi:hypothetical protein
MVNSSSSKSSRSQGKYSHPASKVGPPAKKSAVASIAKAKKAKQETIKKYVRRGKFIVFQLSSCGTDVKLEQMKRHNRSRKMR